MCVVVSPRFHDVRFPPRVHQQCTMKSPLLLPTLVLISLYNTSGVFSMNAMHAGHALLNSAYTVCTYN